MSLTPHQKTLLIGLGVLAALMVFTIWLGPVSASRLENRLTAAVQDALSSSAHRWARVEVNGQTAILSGRWPDEDQRSDTIEAITSAEWSGGWLAGGITTIIDNSIAQDAELGSQFSAVLEAGRLRLSGVAASDEQRQSLEELATLLFPRGVDSRFSIRSSSDVGPDWIQAAEQLLASLAAMEEGLVRLDTEFALIYGQTANMARAENALVALEVLPGDLRRIGLVSDGQQVFGYVPDISACERLLVELLQAGQVRFNPGSASLSASARETVRRMSEAFQACPPARLSTSIRPVVAGDDTASELALMRSTAVRDAFVEFGIDADHILASVDGEQDQLVEIRLSERGAD